MLRKSCEYMPGISVTIGELTCMLKSEDKGRQISSHGLVLHVCPFSVMI